CVPSWVVFQQRPRPLPPRLARDRPAEAIVEHLPGWRRAGKVVVRRETQPLRTRRKSGDDVSLGGERGERRALAGALADAERQHAFPALGRGPEDTGCHRPLAGMIGGKLEPHGSLTASATQALA